jgi:hypothetical protein
VIVDDRNPLASPVVRAVSGGGAGFTAKEVVALTEMNIAVRPKVRTME